VLEDVVAEDVEAAEEEEEEEAAAVHERMDTTLAKGACPHKACSTASKPYFSLFPVRELNFSGDNSLFSWNLRAMLASIPRLK
jgi:hypothetical protein